MQLLTVGEVAKILELVGQDLNTRGRRVGKEGHRLFAADDVDRFKSERDPKAGRVSE